MSLKNRAADVGEELAGRLVDMLVRWLVSPERVAVRRARRAKRRAARKTGK